MTTTLAEQSEAIAFCNEAFRNTDWIDTIDTELLEDIQAALATFARHRQNTIPDTSPGTILNECIAELGDSEPFVVSRDGDGWAVRTMPGWRVLQGDTSERDAIVAWLRRLADSKNSFVLTRDYGGRSALRRAAEVISRGDHLTQPTEDKSDG